MAVVVRFSISLFAQLAMLAHTSDCATGDGVWDACSMLQQPAIPHPSPAKIHVDPLIKGEDDAPAISTALTQARRAAETGAVQSILTLPWREGCEEALPMLSEASADELSRICSAAMLPEEACASALSGPLKAPRPWQQAALTKACLGLEDARDAAIQSRLIARATRGNPLDKVGDSFTHAGKWSEDQASDVTEDYNKHAHGAQGLDRAYGVAGAQDFEESLQTKAKEVRGEEAAVGSKIEGPFKTGLSTPVDEVMGWAEPDLNETELEAALAADESWEDANWTAGWTDNESQGFYLPDGYAEASTWYVEENISADANLPEELEETTTTTTVHRLESWELGYDEADDALVNSSIDFGDSGPHTGYDSEDGQEDGEASQSTDGDAAKSSVAEGSDETVAGDSVDEDSDATNSEGVAEGSDETVPATNSEGVDDTLDGNEDKDSSDDSLEGTGPGESEGEVEIPGTSVTLAPPPGISR